MKYHILTELLWRPYGDEPWLAALEASLAAWDGTPYQSGQSCRGVAADCIGSAFGVLDGLEKNGGPAWRQLPPDVALHAPRTARAAYRRLLRRYPTAVKVERDDSAVRAQPGDVVVMGPSNGSPGHVAIVGPRRNTLWHSTEGPGFRQDGWGLASTMSLVAVYRLRSRTSWTA